MTSLGSSLSSDTSRAGLAWTSRYSTGVRTSSNSTGLPRCRMASSSLGVIVATLISSSLTIFQAGLHNRALSRFEQSDVIILMRTERPQQHRLDFPPPVALLQYSRFR